MTPGPPEGPPEGPAERPENVDVQVQATRIDDAWRAFERTVQGARAALDRARAQPVHSPEERRELERDARSGALGPEMQQLAEHVVAGRTTWSEVFAGDSIYTDLLARHLQRMLDNHAEEVRIAVEDDPDFDPLAASPEVEAAS